MTPSGTTDSLTVASTTFTTTLQLQHQQSPLSRSVPTNVRNPSNWLGDLNANISLGKNLRTKAKSKILTGCKEFPRKPIHEHRAGRKVFDLTDDPFSSQPSLPPRTPTESEHLLGDAPSVDQSGNLHVLSTPLSRYNDFDTICSSSPEAQSTPRIRLEPSFAAGSKKTLKNVPADSRSLFDPDNSDIFGQYSGMDVDAEPPNKTIASMHMEADNELVTNLMKADAVKRKGSQVTVPHLGIELPHKRAKKHPSPSKADLEQWGEAMEVYKDHARRHGNELTSAGLTQTSTIPVLTAVDPNGKIGEWKQPKKGEMTRAAESMPNLTAKMRRQSLRNSVLSTIASTKEKAGKRHRRQYSKQKAEESSEMDIDELQTNDSAYHIGMGKL